MIDYSSKKGTRLLKRKKLETEKARSENYLSIHNGHCNVNYNDGRRMEFNNKKNGGYQQQGSFQNHACYQQQSSQLRFDEDNHIRGGRGGRGSNGSQLRQENRRMVHNYTSASSIATGSKNVNDDSIEGRRTNINKNKILLRQCMIE